MISEKIGILWKRNTKNKLWRFKLGLSLIISNIFFFLLFSNSKSKAENIKVTAPGQVEIQLEAQLLTPFQTGKKILIVNRSKRKKIEGLLISQQLEDTNKLIVLVSEKEANTLFHYSDWEILPYMKYLSFASNIKGYQHEIRY
jgi:hypothetical protein